MKRLMVVVIVPAALLLLQSCRKEKEPEPVAPEVVPRTLAAASAGASCSPAEGSSGVQCWQQYVDSGAGELVLKCVYKNTYTHTHSHKKTHAHNGNTHTGSGTYSEQHTHSAGSACQ